MKQCSRCGVVKKKTDFYTSKKSSDGYRGTCKQCASELAKIRSLKPKIKPNNKKCIDCGEIKLSSMFNKNKSTKDGLHSYCKKCHALRSRSYILKNHEEKKSYLIDYYHKMKNNDRYRNMRQKYAKNYIKNENVKLARRLKRQLWGFIKNAQKSNNLSKYIGIDRDGFINYLKSKFKEGMTIDNYGKIWEIDHIKPCVLFDHSKEEDLKVCWHYTNMQPLTKFENNSKGASF